MALPVLVNSLFLFPPGVVVSLLTAGMVPTPAGLLFINVGLTSENGIATADAFGNYTAPNSTGFNPGGICFDGANVWTAVNDAISPPFGNSQTFTQWDDATLLPITTITLAATTGNGTTSGDCVVWNGKVWQLANTDGTGPPQLIANDLSTIPRLPVAAVTDVSRLLVAGGHLYYFQTEVLAGIATIYLIIDGVTKIATTLPASTDPVPINGVAGTAWDGSEIWVTLPTQNEFGTVKIDGTVDTIYSFIIDSPTTIAVDFAGNIWVGNSSNSLPAIPIDLVVFNQNVGIVASFGYGVTNLGITNIVSDSFTHSIWVAYFTGGATRQLDQYQYPAAGTSGKFVGTFVGILTPGNIAGGTR